jgi:hypothetical protein
LEINVDDTAAAATLLETQLGTRDYKIVGANSLRLYSHLEQPAAVVQTLVAGGVAVSGLGEVGDSLEDFYRCLIEEEGGDGGGSGGGGDGGGTGSGGDGGGGGASSSSGGEGSNGSGGSSGDAAGSSSGGSGGDTPLPGKTPSDRGLPNNERTR